MLAQIVSADSNVNRILTILVVFSQLVSGMLALPVLGIVIFGTLLIGPLELLRRNLPQADFSPAQLSFLDVSLFDPFAHALSVAFGLIAAALAASLIAMILLVIWAWRLHANLTKLGAKGIRFKSAFSIILWLIPVVNLILPYLFLKELWRGSDPAGLVERRLDHNEPGALLGVWWITFLASIGWIICTVLIYGLAVKYLDTPLPSVALLTQYKYGLATAIIGLWMTATALVFVNFLGVILTTTLQEMQVDRYRLFMARQRRS